MKDAARRVGSCSRLGSRGVRPRDTCPHDRRLSQPQVVQRDARDAPSVASGRKSTCEVLRDHPLRARRRSGASGTRRSGGRAARVPGGAVDGRARRGAPRASTFAGSTRETRRSPRGGAGREGRCGAGQRSVRRGAAVPGEQAGPRERRLSRALREKLDARRAGRQGRRVAGRSGRRGGARPFSAAGRRGPGRAPGGPWHGAAGRGRSARLDDAGAGAAARGGRGTARRSRGASRAHPRPRRLTRARGTLGLAGASPPRRERTFASRATTHSSRAGLPRLERLVCEDSAARPDRSDLPVLIAGGRGVQVLLAGR